MSPIKYIARAPTRVDLAGGTLDIWPLFHIIQPVFTINFGINLLAQTSLEIFEDQKPSESFFEFVSEDLKVQEKISHEALYQNNLDQSNIKLPLLSMLTRALWPSSQPTFRMVTQAGSPAGAGLGGSSALALTIAAALNEYSGKKTEHELVACVRDVEARLIHTPTGIQDYWGAARGGLNIISFPPGEPQITTLDASFLQQDYEWIFVDTGVSRQSGINNWDVFKQVFEKNTVVLAQLKELALISEQMKKAIEERDTQETLRLSQLDWQARCSLCPSIQTQESDELSQAALQAGALLSRLCGAGGGGVLVVAAPKDLAASVKEALKKKSSSKTRFLDVSFCATGLSYERKFAN